MCGLFCIKYLHSANNMTMKKFLVLLSLSVALATGFAMPASAQHCNVQKGDSMWRIAKRYKIHFHDILRMNKHFKDQDLIHPNDKVHLPDGSTGESTNQDAKGDETPSQSTGASTSSEAEAVLNLVNQERSKQGLNPLTLSNKLTSIANTKAQDMADKNYFSHTSPTYGSPFDMLHEFGVSYTSAGENIAAGQKTPEQVMNDWMNSSGHRANILNKDYTQLGVGYVKGGSYGTEWVQLFIRP